VVSWPIFVVEDDPDAREALSDILTARGYRVSAAENGKEALDHLRRGFRPAVILLDLMMPVMDGHEFLEHIGKDPAFKDVAIIVVTAALASEAATVADSVDAVIPKPISLPRLLETISSLCAAR
jgi:two-component system, chemotaxis family, chemotaxis protein CheY